MISNFRGLGVGTEDIMTDYMISNESCVSEAEAMVAKLAGKQLREEERQGIWDAFIAKEEYLQAAFEEMRFEENEAFQRRIFG
jgi:protein tyrosine/serine phosphatase